MDVIRVHSVTLNKEKCKGCTACIKNCPTEAIRVRDGKAQIIDEICIDCGECIRVCPYYAKIAVTDPLEKIYDFKYKIALPAPTLYGQFKGLKDINKVLYGLLSLGFDDVYEVAKAADYTSAFIRRYMKQENIKKPAISSACPSIARLIQVRFPELIEHIVPIDSPMEMASDLAKNEFSKKHNVDKKDIGTFFITPCPAKMTAVKNPIGKEKSSLNGAISIIDIYGRLVNALNIKIPFKEDFKRASSYGVSWASSSGEANSLNIDKYLAVDGIKNVIKVLEEIENNNISDLDFLECLSCTGGCVGGPLTFENGYVCKNRISRISKTLDKTFIDENEILKNEDKINWKYTKKIKANTGMELDSNILESLKMMEKIKNINERLPGLDCGACGSPTCTALAEDIVKGEAKENDCVYILREEVQNLKSQLNSLNLEKRGDK